MESFNCCTNGQLPDLSSYQSLEINAVYSFANPEGETSCEAIFGVASGEVDAEEALAPNFDKNELFYTVYGRDEDGYAEALHDENSLESIKLIAAEIQKQYPHLTITIN